MFMLMQLFIFILTLYHARASELTVPVLMWSPERSLSHLPEVRAHEALKSDDFLNTYLDPLMKTPTESAVIFLQNKLHVDDFTKFADVYSLKSDGGSFKNIKHLMDNHFSLEFPKVVDPNLVLKKLKSFYKDVYTANSVEDVENLDLNTQNPFLLIIHLKPIHDEEQETSIAKNDETIGAVSAYLQERNIKYTALFTGESAGDAMADTIVSYNNRHLLEVSAEPSNVNGTFMNVSRSDGGLMYVFMREGQLCVKNSTTLSGPTCSLNLTLSPTETTASESYGGNDTATVILLFANVTSGDDIYDVRIIMDVVNFPDRWVMTSVTLNLTALNRHDMNTSLENATLNRDTLDLTVPFPYSFHCTELTMYVDEVRQKDLKEYKGTFITLSSFQIQPFNVPGDYFFHPQDCVPYFTTGIWMALFSSAFLLAILFFGTIMVLNLSIMDRYDDPKGKTIVVNQGAE
ncbi:unnamed protein product [Lymnaea stagnalis]|uniref:V-type proton ATPase subunit S1/VOA1 transmembrane domain-containing protein n=1 Tax=Lymnaea stagnalis TaxID=6523 RepID=A0AAV2IHR2_LYMST